MAKKIKVYLQYPWRFSEDHCYKTLVECPPKRVEFITSKKEDNGHKMRTSREKVIFFNQLKTRGRKILNFARLPIPNAVLTKSHNPFDVVHCVHCLSKNKKPWVVDVEGAWQFWISGDNTKLGKKVVEKYLKSEYCKKILPWTEESKKDLFKNFQDKEIREKIETVYPAVPVQKFKKRKHSRINLLFVGRYFYQKGGFDALKVFEKLTEKYEDVNAILISNAPEEIMKKYKDHERIKIYSLMLHDEILEKIFPKSDIFVYPGYSDSFGFVFLEAMSFGLPIVTVDGFSRREIVSEGKNGFVVTNPVIGWKKDFPLIRNRKMHHQEIIDKVSRLIENKKLREKMSRDSYKEIKSGKFSIKHRNAQLNRIYGEAMK